MAAHAFLMAGVIDIIVMAFYAIDRLVIGVREGHRQNWFRTAKVPGPPDLQITRPQDDYSDQGGRYDDGKKYNLHPETFRTSVKRATPAADRTRNVDSVIGRYGFFPVLRCREAIIPSTSPTNRIF